MIPLQVRQLVVRAAYGCPRKRFRDIQTHRFARLIYDRQRTFASFELCISKGYCIFSGLADLQCLVRLGFQFFFLLCLVLQLLPAVEHIVLS